MAQVGGICSEPTFQLNARWSHEGCDWVELVVVGSRRELCNLRDSGDMNYE